MIPKEVAESLMEVDEELVVNAAEMIGGDNNFKKLLFLGDMFKRAGMKPIYLVSADHQNIAVSSEETFNKPLH